MSKRLCSDVIAIERAHLDVKGVMKGDANISGISDNRYFVQFDNDDMAGNRKFNTLQKNLSRKSGKEK